LWDRKGRKGQRGGNLDALYELVSMFIVIGNNLVWGSIGYIVIVVKFGIYVLACDCHLAGSNRAIVVSSN